MIIGGKNQNGIRLIKVIIDLIKIIIIDLNTSSIKDMIEIIIEKEITLNIKTIDLMIDNIIVEMITNQTEIMFILH